MIYDCTALSSSGIFECVYIFPFNYVCPLDYRTFLYALGQRHVILSPKDADY